MRQATLSFSDRFRPIDQNGSELRVARRPNRAISVCKRGEWRQFKGLRSKEDRTAMIRPIVKIRAPDVIQLSSPAVSEALREPDIDIVVDTLPRSIGSLLQIASLADPCLDRLRGGQFPLVAQFQQFLVVAEVG